MSCGAAPRAVGSHFPPRWYVAHAFRAQAVAMHPWRQRGGTAWAASRVPRGWAAGRRRTSWPALPSRHRCGRATRAASGGHWEATGPPAEARPRAARPRGAVSVPAFRRPARVRTRVACNIGTELWYHRVELRCLAEERSRIERSVRQSLCLTATMPITAAARVLSHWTLPAPPRSRSALDSTVEMVRPVPRAPRPTLAVCVRLSLSLFVSPRAHPSSRQGSWSAPQTQGTLP